MPATPIEFFQEKEGRSQVVTFLEYLKKNDLPAFAKCVAQIERLEEMGHELRRPTADFLRDGIYELRASKGSVNYRLLYFFSQSNGRRCRYRPDQGGSRTTERN